MLQISNWKGDAGSSSSKKGAKQKLEIVLPVPAGQEELAELLIKGGAYGCKQASACSYPWAELRYC
jgi:hypothetical protein